jgi:uncharacterized membrane protein YfcA
MHALSAFVEAHGLYATLAVVGVMFLGGLVKGAIGFALPLITVGLLGSFLSAQTAVALTIGPMIASNLLQSGREGLGAALATLMRFRVLLAVLIPMIFLCSQLLASIEDRVFFLTLGVGVSLFAASQLRGWKPTAAARHPRKAEVAAGLVGGFFGGVAGIWGPPVTLYLLAIELPKTEMIRALGVIFLVGAVALTGGQIVSGVLNPQTGPLTLMALVPVMAGMFVGFRIQDRIDQATFRKATLVALVLTGLNLLRRGLTL